jgi:uncharacterized protein YndB with AHSA1/START domain
MASIFLEVTVRAPAERVWKRLTAIGEAHKLFAGVLSDCRLEREDLRVVTFANGLVVKEQIVDIDPARMRIVYTARESPLEHHSASMQVGAIGRDTCRFTWITDVLPHDAADGIRPLMEAGAAALKASVESGGRGAASVARPTPAGGG